MVCYDAYFGGSGGDIFAAFFELDLKLLPCLLAQACEDGVKGILMLSRSITVIPSTYFGHATNNSLIS